MINDTVCMNRWSESVMKELAQWNEPKWCTPSTRSWSSRSRYGPGAKYVNVFHAAVSSCLVTPWHEQDLGVQQHFPAGRQKWRSIPLCLCPFVYEKNASSQQSPLTSSSSILWRFFPLNSTMERICPFGTSIVGYLSQCQWQYSCPGSL